MITAYKILLVFVLFLIIVSLAYSARQLVKGGRGDQARSKAMLTGLKARVLLSATLLILLGVGIWQDWVTPHGIYP